MTEADDSPQPCEISPDIQQGYVPRVEQGRTARVKITHALYDYQGCNTIARLRITANLPPMLVSRLATDTETSRDAHE